MSPWLRKVLGERTQICYGYGEEGEFFYLQHTLGANRAGHARFEELVAKADAASKANRTLPGGIHFWGPGDSQRHILKYTGSPFAKRVVSETLGHDEEWEYQRFVLLFRRGRLVDVRPKGTEHPEFLWRETYVPK
jgi:hypothetical protein